MADDPLSGFCDGVDDGADEDGLLDGVCPVLLLGGLELEGEAALEVALPLPEFVLCELGLDDTPLAVSLPLDDVGEDVPAVVLSSDDVSLLLLLVAEVCAVLDLSSCSAPVVPSVDDETVSCTEQPDMAIIKIQTISRLIIFVFTCITFRSLC